MHKKKENIIEKIVKKDYNNEIEKILEEKQFSEDAKSTLLNICYKIETAYKDIETVKRNIETKEEFIENIINIIRQQCDSLEIIKMSDKNNKIPENKTYIIDKEQKKIITYPIERKILYAIAKMGNKEKILRDEYFLLNKTISDLLNVGKNIEMVETIRDFNGYSWTTIVQEIESIDHNLIYQNLRILVGAEFLNKWINNEEYIIDYYDLLKNELEMQFGEEITKEIIQVISKMSILLELKFNSNIKDDYKEELGSLEEQNKKVENKQQFIKEITNKKIEISNKIKDIDTIINDKQLLKKEYIDRNEKLELNQKIFSVKILTKLMIEEREKYLKDIEQLNKLMKPNGFIKYKEEIKNKYELIKILKTENLAEEINEEKITMQEIFLKAIEIKIDKAETKQQIIDLIYQIRYYLMLPFDSNNQIKDLEKFKKLIKQILKKIIQKSNELKVLQKISEDSETNYEILKNLFNVRMIKLENAFIKITKEKDKYYLQILDEDIFEEKIEIKKPKDLEIKLNKNIPIW